MEEFLKHFLTCWQETSHTSGVVISSRCATITSTLHYMQNDSRNSMKIFLQKVPMLLLILVIISKCSLYYLIYYTT